MIIKLNETESTNLTLNNLSKNKALENGTVLISNIQTQGKGQRNNYWESEPYKNLTFSIFYKNLNIHIDKQFYISMAVSLGIIDFLKDLKIYATIKWPNDIYVNNDKICGILIENNISKNKISSTIIGIGLNVNQTSFLKTTKNASSLKLILNKEFSLEDLLPLLLNKIQKRTSEIFNNNFKKIKIDYLNKLYLFNVFNKFSISDKYLKAKIIDVEENGKLVLQTYDGKKLKFFFKEITF